MASFYPSITHFATGGVVTEEELRQLGSLDVGTYAPAAAITIPKGNGVRMTGTGNRGLSFDGSGLVRRSPALEECGHCGCPFPESPCHYCGTRTRRP